MPGWNFADAWEVVAAQGPRRPVPGAGRPPGDAGASSTAGPTASPGSCSTPGPRSRTRSPSTCRTAPSTSSRCSPRSRPASCRSTRTTATPTTSSSTSGTTPTASPSCSTAPFADTHRAHPRPGARRRRPGCGSTTRPAAPCPEWATPYEDAAAAGTDEHVAGPVGPRRRPPPHALHGRHHRHAQGRDVAPGRPVPQPRRRRSTRASARTRVDYGARRRRRRRPRLRRAARLPAHARHRLLHPADPARRPAAPPCCLESRNLDVEELLDTIERESVNQLVIVGDAFAKPILRALDANPGQVGPLVDVHDRQLGRDVLRGVQAGPARPQPDDDDHRRLLVVRGHRHGPVDLHGRRRVAAPRSSCSARTPR